LCAEIRRAIAEGQAAPDERLPPARDLAAVLGVNRNTVLRALRLLREEGLLDFRRGRGITMAGTPQRGAVLATARELARPAVAGPMTLPPGAGPGSLCGGAWAVKSRPAGHA
jgi:DNA-binding GntR family transcriptional regulator